MAKPTMNENSETRTRASFYKLLNDHAFTSQLRLPPQFVKDHGKNLSEKVKLFTASGNLWTVRTEQIGRHRFFTDGWTRFAHDADLRSWEFLFFKLIGKSKFEVSVYETTGCQKELHSRGNIKAENECGLESDQTDDSGDGQNWSFVKKLNRDHTSELVIPKNFAVGTGIVRNKKLKLRVEKGKSWPIHVTLKQCGKLAMRGGWNEFLRGNKVEVGSTISFEFVGGSSNVIEAKVVKLGSDDGKRALFNSAKRKRGRPPKLDGY